MITEQITASGPAGAPKTPVLDVKNLRVDFHTYAGEVKALENINLKLYKGETLGLVGESGCGKSVTATTIVGLLPENAKVVSGEILLEGQDILSLSKGQMREVRAKRIAMVFQDPATFLNPVLTIGEQLGEVFQLDSKRVDAFALKTKISGLSAESAEQGDPSRKSAIQQEIESLEQRRENPPKGSRGDRKKATKAMVKDALTKVRLPDPERIMKEYPHELSGGMKQRCMIAMAIARNPAVLIADEITTALDVTIQAQIVELLRILREEVQSAILVITHDLGVAAETCDRIAVMYAGDVVEVAPVDDLFKNSLHPYTQGLLKSIPKFAAERSKLESIPGSVPDLISPPPGCRFHPRCPHAWDYCQRVRPELFEKTTNHTVACHLYTHGEKR